MDRYVLSIDLGTQGIRSIIFNQFGKLIDKEKIQFDPPYFSLEPGYAEQHPEFYFKMMAKSTLDLKKRQEEVWHRIEAVSITTIRNVNVFVDKNGQVLRPAILWLDHRLAKCKESLPIYSDIIFKAVGMNETIKNVRKKTTVNWIRENEPEVWEDTYKCLMISGYLNYRLTNKYVDSVASQIGHMPFDYKYHKWYSEYHFKWSVFNNDRSKLYDLVDSGTVMGNVTKEASNLTGIAEGTPVIASGSDKGCETLGTGCFNSKVASLSFGTTATIQTTTNFYCEPIKFMPAYPGVVKHSYNPELEVFRGYWLISWFKKEFAAKEEIEALELGISAEEILNRRLQEIPPGSEGLLLQPFWTPGLRQPEARGAMIGFNDCHTRIHIYKAIIEGINYSLMDGMKKIEAATGVKVEKLTVSGGGSQSEEICQITSDMFNLPVYKPETYETSGLGAAISSFVGLGVYKDYKTAVEAMVHYSKVYYPEKRHAEIYKELYEKAYRKIYGSLKDIYIKIQEISLKNR